jgi:hypothetical protein
MTLNSTTEAIAGETVIISKPKGLVQGVTLLLLGALGLGVGQPTRITASSE